jgi:2-methylcitrate dehydratase PrpD
MDCALKIKQKHAPAPDEIAEVVCRTAEGPVHRLWEPLADKQKPLSSYGAKFSLPYSLAVMLVRGRAGLEELQFEAALRRAIAQGRGVDVQSEFPLAS